MLAPDLSIDPEIGGVFPPKVMNPDQKGTPPCQSVRGVLIWGQHDGQDPPFVQGMIGYDVTP